MEVILGVAKVTTASFALNLAAERAVQVTAVTRYPKAHRLVQVAGLDGFSSLLGCLGLCLAFLSVACGIVMGYGAAIMMRKGTVPFLETGCAGLAIFLGCGLSGALLGLVATTLMALGLKGLCLMGFILSLNLLLMNKKQQQTMATPARMLTFSTVAFVTLLLGVWSGQNIDINKPRLYLAMIFVLPSAFLMGFLADMLAFKKPIAYTTLSFVLLVPLTGLLLGLGIENYSKEVPLYYNTFYTIRSAVYTVEMLTGLIGALIGVMSASLWDTDRALSLWISVPAGVILYYLDVDTPHFNLHSLAEWCLGTGGELGLISGLAAASGISLGLVVMSARGQLWSGAVLILILLQAVDNDLLSFNNLIIPLTLPFAHELINSMETRVCMLMDVALSFAILGVVMMGATVLGAGGLLTAALGSAGCYGVALANTITIMKAINDAFTHVGC